MTEKFLHQKIQSEKVFKILINFDEAKTPLSIDDLSRICFKDGATLLATSITQLFNISNILISSISQCRQNSKTKLHFKKRSKIDPKNYRPVFLPPLISKVVERVILDKFQKNTCQTFSSYMPDKIYSCFDSDLVKSKKSVRLIFYYKKCHHLDSQINWLIGLANIYISSRKSYVKFYDKFSKFVNLQYGLSQVSIPGPLLFLVYINEIPKSLDCNLILHADIWYKFVIWTKRYKASNLQYIWLVCR